MAQIKSWCDPSDEVIKKNKLRILDADPARISVGVKALASSVPSHYASAQRIADLLRRLGKEKAAKYIEEKLPTASKIRSGDLGEILASTYVAEFTGYTMSVNRLQWKDHREMAMRGEDIRVRGLALDDRIGESLLSDYELGVAVAAVETGSLSISAALLMRSGFNSRNAAIKVVKDGSCTFTTMMEMRLWLRSKERVQLYDDPNWPTPETSALWKAFVDGMRPELHRSWQKSHEIAGVKWYNSFKPNSGLGLRMMNVNEGVTRVFGADYEALGELAVTLNPDRCGLLRATALDGGDKIGLDYLGPDDLLLKSTTPTN
jgi:hypothetical protein